MKATTVMVIAAIGAALLCFAGHLGGESPRREWLVSPTRIRFRVLSSDSHVLSPSPARERQGGGPRVDVHDWHGVGTLPLRPAADRTASAELANPLALVSARR